MCVDRRSVPGQVLLAMDRNRVELRPMRAHLKNEIIAWQDASKVWQPLYI